MRSVYWCCGLRAGVFQDEAILREPDLFSKRQEGDEEACGLPEAVLQENIDSLDEYHCNLLQAYARTAEILYTEPDKSLSEEFP